MNKRLRKKRAKKVGLSEFPKGWIWKNGTVKKISR